MLMLVTGGVKSGKSQLAQRSAEALSKQPLMIATAQRLDGEFNARIQHHIDTRPDHWRTVEAPLELAKALAEHPKDVIVVDCVGVWLTNLLVETPDQRDTQVEQFIQVLKRRSEPTFIVSNESGFGVIGADSLTRQFIDELGLLNQKLAQLSTHFVTNFSGYPIWLKGNPIFKE